MWQGLAYMLVKAGRFALGSGGLTLARGGGRVSGLLGGKAGAARGLLTKLPKPTDRRLTEAAAAAAVETTRAMLEAPGVRASVEAALLRLVGSSQAHTGSNAEPLRAAVATARMLQSRGIDPNRLGVDGVPGSGKSTFARALADELGGQWKSLDHENMNEPRDFAPERTVYEHHRLFRTQDVDVFDAIVYVDEPIEVAKDRVVQRARKEGRTALLIDVLDYEKLKQIGKLAFDVCDGQPIAIPDSHLLMKIRPPGGFRALENTLDRLRAAGHEFEPDMGKEQMLFLLAYGIARAGMTAYFLPGAYNHELLKGILAGIRSYLPATGGRGGSR